MTTTTPVTCVDGHEFAGYDANGYAICAAGHVIAGSGRLSLNGHASGEMPIAEVVPHSTESADSAVSTHRPRPFPVDALPPTGAQRLVKEGAAALDCPPDLIAVPLLAITAGVMGNRHRLQLKLGYEQRAILWTAAVAKPGTAKTPAEGIAQAPLEELQREAHERFTETRDTHDAEMTAWTNMPKDERGAKPVRPVEEHYYSTDATIEGVARMLGDGDQTPGFVLIRDELAGWVKAFDAYRSGRGGDRQTWLSLWAGAAFRSNRAGRDSIYVPSPAVSVTGGIQPDRLLDLVEEAQQRDGFLERVLWSYPDTQPMTWTEATVSREAIDAMTEVYRLLRAARDDAPVTLSKDAKALFVSWHAENTKLIGQASGLIEGIYAKLPNQLARLALVLHALWHPASPAEVPLSARTMADAIELVEYFREHGQRVMRAYGGVAITGSAHAARVWRILSTHGTWVDMTEQRQRLGGHVTADAHRQALEELERLGLAEGRKTQQPQGGRPLEEWRALTRASSAKTVETVETPDSGEVSTVNAVST